MRSFLSLKGWRLRGFMAVSEILVALRLFPGGAKVMQMPLEKRAAMGPAPWMLLPIPEVTVERGSVNGRECVIPVKKFLPKVSSDRACQILFIHGGGWFAGNEDSLDYLCTNLCDRLGLNVTSVGYRLAPDFPFPAGLNDCEDVLKTIAVDGRSVIVVGDSAGGNLAAALCLKARGEVKIERQVLIYPFLDGTLQSASIDPPRLGLRREDMVDMVNVYKGNAKASNPYISPICSTDLSALPPALIITADCDPLRDDGSRYADCLREAGVPVRYENYLRMPHGFLSLASICSVAPEAIDLIVGELR